MRAFGFGRASLLPLFEFFEITAMNLKIFDVCHRKADRSGQFLDGLRKWWQAHSKLFCQPLVAVEFGCHVRWRKLGWLMRFAVFAVKPSGIGDKATDWRQVLALLAR